VKSPDVEGGSGISWIVDPDGHEWAKRRDGPIDDLPVVGHAPIPRVPEHTPGRLSLSRPSV